MTREEAIKICVREKEQIQQALDVCADGDNYVSPDGMITALDYVEAMGMAIAALREQPRWISVEERLPEDFGYYIVFSEENIVGEAEWDGHTFCWIANENLAFATHWMPLPEPPEVEV